MGNHRKREWHVFPSICQIWDCWILTMAYFEILKDIIKKKSLDHVCMLVLLIMRYWFQDPPWISKSADAQGLYTIKWHWTLRIVSPLHLWIPNTIESVDVEPVDLKGRLYYPFTPYISIYHITILIRKRNGICGWDLENYKHFETCFLKKKISRSAFSLQFLLIFCWVFIYSSKTQWSSKIMKKVSASCLVCLYLRCLFLQISWPVSLCHLEGPLIAVLI